MKMLLHKDGRMFPYHELMATNKSVTVIEVVDNAKDEVVEPVVKAPKKPKKGEMIISDEPITDIE